MFFWKQPLALVLLSFLFFVQFPLQTLAVENAIKLVCVNIGMVGFQDNYQGKIKPDPENEKFFLTYHRPTIEDPTVEPASLTSEVFFGKMVRIIIPDYFYVDPNEISSGRWRSQFDDLQLGFDEPENFLGQYTNSLEYFWIFYGNEKTDFRFIHLQALNKNSYLSEGKCTKIN